MIVKTRAKGYYRRASALQRAQGAGWYSEANTYARGLSAELGLSLAKVAGTLAITSVNQTWKGNKTLTERHLRHGWVGGLPQVRDQLAKGCPKGRKVTNFAKAIEGDEEVVVVDRWMIRAFDMPAGRKAYPEIETGIRDAAHELGISPRALQATIWVMARGRDK